MGLAERNTEARGVAGPGELVAQLPIRDGRRPGSGFLPLQRTLRAIGTAIFRARNRAHEYLPGRVVEAGRGGLQRNAAE